MVDVVIGEVLGEKTFYPSDEKALSVFEISGEYSLRTIKKSENYKQKLR